MDVRMRLIKKIQIAFFLSIVLGPCWFALSHAQNSSILVFLDNSQSIQRYNTMFRTQINLAFRLAEDNKKKIEFASIGQDPFQQCRNSGQSWVFHFQDIYTRINDSFLHAQDSVDHADTIVIVSDMEPDHTNTGGNWNFKAQDYSDIAQFVNTLRKWRQHGKTIYLVLLSECEELPTFGIDELNVEAFLDEMATLSEKARQYEQTIGEARRLNPGERYPRYVRTPEQNRLFVYKALRVVEWDGDKVERKGAFHLSSLPPKKSGEDLGAILQDIIDPRYDEIRVKIEVEPQLMDFSTDADKPYQKYFSSVLPDSVGTNPPKRVTYDVVNNERKLSLKHDENYNYHYHLYRMRGAVLRLTYQKMGDDEVPYLETDVSEIRKRNENNIIHWASKETLARQAAERMQMIRNFIPDDFPAPVKQKLVYVIGQSGQNYQGYQLVARYEKGKDIKSPPILADGSTYIYIKKHVDARIALTSGAKGSMNFLRVVSASEIRSAVPIKIEVIEVPDIFAEVTFRLTNPTMPESPIQDLDFLSAIEIVRDDENQYQTVEKRDSFTDPADLTFKIVSGSYRHIIRFNPGRPDETGFIDLWLEQFRADSGSDILLQPDMIRDELKSENEAKTFFSQKIAALNSIGNNELDVEMKNHIMGSRYFLIRLLEFTATYEQSTPRITGSDIVALWRRVRRYIFTELRDAYRSEMLKNAYLEIWLEDRTEIGAEPRPHPCAERVTKYLMDVFIWNSIMRHPQAFGRSDVRESKPTLDTYCRNYYNRNVIRRMKDSGMNEKFIELIERPKQPVNNAALR